MTTYVRKKTGEKYKAVIPIGYTNLTITEKTHVYIEKPSVFLQKIGGKGLMLVTLEELNQHFTKLEEQTDDKRRNNTHLHWVN